MTISRMLAATMVVGAGHEPQPPRAHKRPATARRQARVGVWRFRLLARLRSGAHAREQ